MQANKVSETTTQELKQWLEKPGTSAEAGLGINTQQDLQWLQTTKDLSSIALNERDNIPESKEEVNGDNGGSGGGFMALFGCGGKRK